MIKQIETLVQFHSMKWHTPITLMTQDTDLLCWHEVGIAVRINVDRKSSFCTNIEGDPLVMESEVIGKVSPTSLVLYDDPRIEVASNILDQHLPRMCRAFRKTQRVKLVESIQSVAAERKQELARSLRDDKYELERLCTQVMTQSRKMEVDREILRMFSKTPDFLKAKATRTFVEMMKLVPSCYSHIKVVEKSVIAESYPITLVHDGHSYDFEPFIVEVDMTDGEVTISGGTELGGFVHPHVKSDSKDICWGNIGHLVSRLAGECDVHGLLQLVHQFLNSYNSSDPFQRIEKWDPDWVEENDDDDPYCSWCDDYGHEIDNCESCWWCEHCQQYDDHDEEGCPNRPKDEDEEEEDADAELAEKTATAG